MFAVKATYNNETRKLTFKESTFPSYDEICGQLYRVFPIGGSYYFNKLIFCPTEGTRVIVGKEVHNEAEYAAHIAPFAQLKWPGGVLRFYIVDETPHKIPAAHLQQQQNQLLFMTRNTQSSSYNQKRLSSSCQASAASPTNDITRSFNIPRIPSVSTLTSCCSVAESREEIKSLMSKFLADFTSIVTTNLGEASEVTLGGTVTPKAVTPKRSTASVPVPSAEVDSAMLPIPGAFIQRHQTSLISEPSLDFSGGRKLHPGITCDECDGPVCGLRFKCTICLDFDLCEKCMDRDNALESHRARFPAEHLFGVTRHHEFRVIPTPSDTTAREHSTRPVTNARPVVHANIKCDRCNSTVIGVRHKCLDCPDFDLCDACAPYADTFHFPRHQFYALTEPGRVIVHKTYVDDESLLPAASEVVVHRATCDLCGSSIRGTRYKCLSCPDYDTCSQCIAITNEQHPNHTFVKITESQMLALRDPALRLKHSASCNECGDQIRGVRYKCMHPSCPDYDLCQKCEALPIAVHPANHPMLKMRDPHTVIPTVYRVGGTSPIKKHAYQCPFSCHNMSQSEETLTVSNIGKQVTFADAAVAASEPAPSKVEASVETDAIYEDELPSRGLSPAPVEPFENFQLLVDYFRSSGARKTKSAPLKEESLHDAETPEPLASLTAGSLAFFDAHNGYERSGESAEVDASTFAVVGAPAQESHADHMGEEKADTEWFKHDSHFMRALLVNDAGEATWRASTESPSIASDGFAAFGDAPTQYDVRQVESGGSVNVYAKKQKASLESGFGPADQASPETCHLEETTCSSSGILNKASLIAHIRSFAQKRLENRRHQLSNAVPDPQGELCAEFVDDENVADGQVFPAGAEFIKTWRMQNIGDNAWPESTKLIFVAGDRMSAYPDAPDAFHVGWVAPGKSAFVCVLDMKAPELPGQYVGYWRLVDGNGVRFGDSVWCNITVSEPEVHNEVTHSSLSSSEVIMPGAATLEEGSDAFSTAAVTAEEIPPSSIPSTSSDASEAGDSSVSLMDEFETASDEELWETSRSQVVQPREVVEPDTEYVVLYDSSDEE